MSDLDHYMLWDGRKLESLPRPGRFEVVSWQMNVTVYPPSGTVRVTSAITDPREHLTLHVAKFETRSFELGRQAVGGQALETLRAIGYITGLSKGV